MRKYKDKAFKGEKVFLGRSEYERCSFEDCEMHLEYGTTKVANCEFKNCTLHLSGPASTIAMVIKLFYPDAFPVIE
ncbi:MAG: hypothetical protein ABSG57_01415 [Candidatus Bathyarchaeia archaeon]